MKVNRRPAKKRQSVGVEPTGAQMADLLEMVSDGYKRSFSTGRAYVPPGGEATLEGLLSKPDQEMYAQKRGRCRARAG